MPFMIESLGFPDRSEDEPQDGCHGERRNRLVPYRFVDGTLEVAGNLLDLIADFASLLGDPAREMLSLIGHITELVRGLVGDLFELICYLHVEVIDLLSNRVEADIGVGFFVAAFSALRSAPLAPALLVLGDMSIQGNLKPTRSLVEPLQVGMDNGAKRALIPIENRRNFLEVASDIVEHVDPIFYGDPKMAAFKALGAV